MAISQSGNWRWMVVDAHSAAVNAVNGPAIHRRPPMIFNLKKNRCTVLMTSHITWRHLYNASVYLKIKVCMEWVSEFEALHFNTIHDLYSTTLNHHYSTVLTTLHDHYCTALHCTHFTAMCSLHCTTTTPLHFTLLTTLHCAHYTAPPPLLHCTVLYSLDCMLWSSFN